MQFYINSMLIVFTIVVTNIFISIKKILSEKRMNKVLIECIVCKDCIIDEFTKIRHEYNNILQTLTCFIEEEDLEGLKDYKRKLLEKTHLLNSNSITQLIKIKDINILRSVSKLLLKAKEEGVVLIITIYNDITNQSLYKDQYYYVLKECLIHAYQSGVKETMVIHLKISSNDKGLSFIFDNVSNVESFKLISSSMKSRKYIMDNNIFLNTLYKNDHFIQEMLISFYH